MMNKIGRERGWPPSGRAEYDALRSPRGAVAAGSPEQVAEKILFEHELFGNSRYLGQMSVGAVAHKDVLRSMELFGTEVAPVVRAEVARRDAARARSRRPADPLVQSQRLARRAIPRVGAVGGAARGHRQLLSLHREATRSASTRAGRPIPGATSRAAPTSATSEKPRCPRPRPLADGQRTGQHP